MNYILKTTYSVENSERWFRNSSRYIELMGSVLADYHEYLWKKRREDFVDGRYSADLRWAVVDEALSNGMCHGYEYIDWELYPADQNSAQKSLLYLTMLAPSMHAALEKSSFTFQAEDTLRRRRQIATLTRDTFDLAIDVYLRCIKSGSVAFGLEDYYASFVGTDFPPLYDNIHDFEDFIELDYLEQCKGLANIYRRGEMYPLMDDQMCYVFTHDPLVSMPVWHGLFADLPMACRETLLSDTSLVLDHDFIMSSLLTSLMKFGHYEVRRTHRDEAEWALGYILIYSVEPLKRDHEERVLGALRRHAQTLHDWIREGEGPIGWPQGTRRSVPKGSGAGIYRKLYKAINPDDMQFVVPIPDPEVERFSAILNSLHRLDDVLEFYQKHVEEGGSIPGYLNDFIVREVARFEVNLKAWPPEDLPGMEGVSEALQEAAAGYRKVLLNK